MVNKSQGGSVFFVFKTSSRTVHEYKDLNSLLEAYTSTHSEDDFFWTLGLASWKPITMVLTDELLQKRKFQFPDAPSSQPQSPKAQTVPRPTPPQPAPKIPETKVAPTAEADFKIISYEPSDEITAIIPPPTGQAQKPTGPINQRKFPRHDIRLKVIISNKSKTFLSYTSNVSVGGVALEDNIPREFFIPHSESEIFICSPKKNEFLAFRCQPVGDDQDPKRFSFGEIPEQSMLKFQNWIDRLKNSPTT